MKGKKIYVDPESVLIMCPVCFQLYQCHLPTGKWQKIVTMGKKPEPMYGQVGDARLLDSLLCFLHILSFVSALESLASVLFSFFSI